MSVAAVVAAAGRGTRLGGDLPKAFRLLGGTPLLVHAIDALRASRYVSHIVVAAPLDLIPEVHRLLDAAAATHIPPAAAAGAGGAAAVAGVAGGGPGGAGLRGVGISVVAGGEHRQDSVNAALAALPDGVEVVLVHDAARPLVPVGVIDAVVAAVLAGAAAAVPVLPVVDTLKRVHPDGSVAGTVSRAELRAVQTPQGFRRDVLARAHAAADPDLPATDDAGLVELLGVPVATVPGSVEALKITTPFDLVIAETILRHRMVP